MAGDSSGVALGVACADRDVFVPGEKVVAQQTLPNMRCCMPQGHEPAAPTKLNTPPVHYGWQTAKVAGCHLAGFAMQTHLEPVKNFLDS